MKNYSNRFSNSISNLVSNNGVLFIIFNVSSRLDNFVSICRIEFRSLTTELFSCFGTFGSLEIYITLLHLLESALLAILRFYCEAHRAELICIWLWFTEAFRCTIGVSFLLLLLFGLVTLFIEDGLVGLCVLDLDYILLHLDHHSFDTLAHVSIEN